MINILIVLYNKKIEDSLTFNCLKDIKGDLKFVIFDNSNKEYISHNMEYASKNDIVYYTLNENVGIARAYNYVIDRISLNDNDYVVILDDDTNLSEEYINEMRKLSKESEYDIILPKIKAGNTYISPAEVRFGCRIRVVKDFSNLNSTNISAINSGMIIRTSVFKKIRYNDDLFLDYVDHDFMKQSRMLNLKFKIMDSTIIQNYSRFQKNDLEQEMFRFKIYLKDFRKYCKKCSHMGFYHLSVLKYKIRQVLKYKSIKFMFMK